MKDDFDEKTILDFSAWNFIYIISYLISQSEKVSYDYAMSGCH
jgi:hypothetical protein